jgi:hypothetical protein
MNTGCGQPCSKTNELLRNHFDAQRYGDMIVERSATGFDVEVYDWQAEMLQSLIAPLRDLLIQGSSPVLRRLYPTAYPQDAEADAAYGELVHDQLLEQRLTALDTLERSMTASHLSEEELIAWMMSINSIRLVLGTRLDVGEDDEPMDVDEDDPDRPLWLSYGLLSQMLWVIIDAMETPA